jgi:hypothetical protein
LQAELKRYVYRSLPAAGWAFADRLTTACFFYRGDRRLMVLQTFDLRAGKTKLEIIISKK